MLYSCTHIATVGVKGLKLLSPTDSQDGDEDLYPKSNMLQHNFVKIKI